MASRPSREPSRRLSFGTLYLGSILYQVSLVGIAIVLPQIGSSLIATPSQQGMILAGFPLGFGSFAFLSGFWVRRYGPTRTIFSGLVVLGLGGVASAAAFSPATLFAARLLGGLGAGTYFPVIIGLLAANTPEHRRATNVGLLVSLGLAIGGAAEILGGAIVAPRFGWQVVLGGTGVVVLVGAFLTASALHRAPLSLAPLQPSLDPALLGPTLRMVSVWALTIALLGVVNAGFTSIGFLAAYVSSQHPSWGIMYVGAVLAAALALTLPGGLLGGWASERGVDRRVVLTAFAVCSGVLFLLIPWANEYSLAAILAALGLLMGAVLAVLFSMPSHIPEMGGVRVPIVVGVLDGTRILFSATFALVFGVVVGLSGYSTAWTLTAIIGLGCIPAIALVPPNRAGEGRARPVSMG
jgi:predicted MFS family arabinose efflux permease